MLFLNTNLKAVGDDLPNYFEQQRAEQQRAEQEARDKALQAMIQEQKEKEKLRRMIDNCR